MILRPWRYFFFFFFFFFFRYRIANLKFQEAFLLPLMQRQAMEELRVVKKANDKLAQELAEVKLERDQFFPVRPDSLCLPKSLNSRCVPAQCRS